MFDQTFNFLNHLDLTKVHIVLGMVTFLTCVYVMAYEGYEYEDAQDPFWVQWSRRVSYLAIALGVLWSLMIQLETGWQPWPTEILLMIGLLIKFVMRIIAVRLRIWREGHRRPISSSISSWPRPTKR